jgi:hypothetical protein
MTLNKTLNRAERVLAKRFYELLRMRRRFIELKRETAVLEKSGIRLFDDIKKGLRAKAKTKRRRAAKKLKPAPAGN